MTDFIRFIKFKKLREDAVIPTRGSAQAAGLDLYSTEHFVLPPGEKHLFKLGLAMAIPREAVAEIWPRSKLANEYGIDTLAGVVDSDYRGEVGVILINHGSEPVEFKPQDRIAQMLIKPVSLQYPIKVESLDETERGAEGIHSKDLRL